MQRTINSGSILKCDPTDLSGSKRSGKTCHVTIHAYPCSLGGVSVYNYVGVEIKLAYPASRHWFFRLFFEAVLAKRSDRLCSVLERSHLPKCFSTCCLLLVATVRYFKRRRKRLRFVITITFYRAMLRRARLWDCMSSVCLSVRPSLGWKSELLQS